MRNLSALLFLASFGLAACAAGDDELAPGATAHALTLADYPLRSNGRTLVTAAGAPFRWIADTPWALPYGVRRADAVALMDDRKAKGFNTLQVSLVDTHDVKGTNAYGEAPFEGTDISKPRAAYWDHVVWLVDEAGKRGLQLAAVPAWFGYAGETWRGYFTPTRAEALGRYLAQRLGGKSNLVWILGGDDDPIGDVGQTPAGLDRSDAVDAVDAIANAIRSGESKRHLMSYHAGRGRSSGQFFANRAWHTMHFAYSAEQTYRYVLSEWSRSPVLPVVVPEAYYDARTRSPVLDQRRLRAEAYWTFLSGGAGFAYGHENVWDLDAQWKSALGAPSAFDIRDLASFFAGYATEKLVPDHRVGNAAKLLDAGYGAANTNDWAVSATASDRSFAMAYFPTSRSNIVVDLATLGARTELSWWNPASGGSRDVVGTFDAQGTRALSWPSGYADALLVARRVATTPLPPSGVLLRAINLGGGALTIGGVEWQASSAATLSPGMKSFENQAIPLSPAAPSSAHAQMIRASAWGRGGTVSASVPNDTYDVYLTTWEDTRSQVFDVLLEGKVVQNDYVSGATGTWRRLGPWTATVTDGRLDLQTTGGDANLSGLEIYVH